jgi:hypothetical protein
LKRQGRSIPKTRRERQIFRIFEALGLLPRTENADETQVDEEKDLREAAREPNATDPAAE